MQRTPFVCVRGQGAASGTRLFQDLGGTIAAQKPHFKSRGIDLSGMHDATINADISPFRFVIRKPLLSVEALSWHPTLPAENFNLSQACLEIEDRIYPALIYYPCPSPEL